MAALLRGFAAALRGLRMAVANAEVRRAYLKVAALVVSLTIVLDVVGLWLLWGTTGSDGSDVGVGGIAWRALATLMIFLAGPLVVVMTMNLVFPMFNAIPFFAGLRRVAPERAAELSARAGLPLRASLLVSVLRLLRFLMLGALAFALSFVPVVGTVLGPIAQLYVAATALSWELLDPYFDKLGFAYAQQRESISRHRSGLVGFGLPYALLFAIPLVGPLFFGLAQAAVAVFVVDGLEAARARPQPTPAS